MGGVESTDYNDDGTVYNRRLHAWLERMERDGRKIKVLELWRKPSENLKDYGGVLVNNDSAMKGLVVGGVGTTVAAFGWLLSGYLVAATATGLEAGVAGAGVAGAGAAAVGVLNGWLYHHRLVLTLDDDSQFSLEFHDKGATFKHNIQMKPASRNNTIRYVNKKIQLSDRLIEVPVEEGDRRVKRFSGGSLRPGKLARFLENTKHEKYHWREWNCQMFSEKICELYEGGRIEIYETGSSSNELKSVKAGVKDYEKLWKFAKEGNLKELKAMIAFGVDLEAKAKSNYGYTALIFAARNGHTKCVEYLLRAGADIEASTKGQRTALFVAAQFDHIGPLKALIRARADVNARSARYNTPATVAADNGYAHCLRILLDSGAEVKDALTKAEEKNHTKCIGIIKEHLETTAAKHVKTYAYDHKDMAGMWYQDGDEVECEITDADSGTYTWELRKKKQYGLLKFNPGNDVYPGNDVFLMQRQTYSVHTNRGTVNLRKGVVKWKSGQIWQRKAPDEGDMHVWVQQQFSELYRLNSRGRQDAFLKNYCECVAQMVAQIAFALKKNYEAQVVHFDLKLENIFLSNNGEQTTRVKDFFMVPQLINFGMAKHFTNKNDWVYSDGRRGAPRYMSPEIASAELGTRIWDARKCDNWSLGIILWEALTGNPLWDQAKDNCSQYMKFKQSYGFKYFFKELEKKNRNLSIFVPPQAVDLLHIILCHDTDDRADIDAILKHPFLSKYTPRSSDDEPVPVTANEQPKEAPATADPDLVPVEAKEEPQEAPATADPESVPVEAKEEPKDASATADPKPIHVEAKEEPKEAPATADPESVPVEPKKAPATTDSAKPTSIFGLSCYVDTTEESNIKEKEDAIEVQEIKIVINNPVKGSSTAAPHESEDVVQEGAIEDKQEDDPINGRFKNRRFSLIRQASELGTVTHNRETIPNLRRLKTEPVYSAGLTAAPTTWEPQEENKASGRHTIPRSQQDPPAIKTQKLEDGTEL